MWLTALQLGCAQPGAGTADPSPNEPRATVSNPPAPSAGEVWATATARLAVHDYVDDEHGSVSGGLAAQAVAAVRSLPDDDPMAVTVLCEAARSGLFAQVEQRALLRRAIALDARLDRDLRARHASLGRHARRWYHTFAQRPQGSPLTHSLDLSLLVNEDFADLRNVRCADADTAALRLMLIHAVPREEALPLLEDFFTELSRALAPTDPSLATLLEIASDYCGDSGESSLCHSNARRFDRALELRERALGPDHPLTLVSRLNLAAERDRRGDPRGAHALLESVVRAPQLDATAVLALRELGRHHMRRGEWKLASGRFAEAAKLAEQTLDRSLKKERRLLTETWWIHGSVAAYAGDYGASEAAFRRLRAYEPAGTDARYWTYEIAEVLRAAKKYDAATSEYDAWIAAWTRARHDIGAEEGHLGVWLDRKSALIAGYRSRAQALRRLGRYRESETDLRRARSLEESGLQALHTSLFSEQPGDAR